MNTYSYIHTFIYSIYQFYHKLEIQPKVVDFTTNNQRLYFFGWILLVILNVGR